jgi:hypothetical protein
VDRGDLRAAAGDLDFFLGDVERLRRGSSGIRSSSQYADVSGSLIWTREVFLILHLAAGVDRRPAWIMPYTAVLMPPPIRVFGLDLTQFDSGLLDFLTRNFWTRLWNRRHGQDQRSCQEACKTPCFCCSWFRVRWWFTAGSLEPAAQGPAPEAPLVRSCFR